MASFTTRLELVNSDSNDYELLHQEMRDRQFYRSINYCGVWHDLPTGVYDRTYSGSLGDVYSDAGAAAQAVINAKPLNDQNLPKDYYFIVTEGSERQFVLPHTTDVAKLPPGASL